MEGVTAWDYGKARRPARGSSLRGELQSVLNLPEGRVGGTGTSANGTKHQQ